MDTPEEGAGSTERDEEEWNKLYTPTEKILDYARLRGIPSSYVRIGQHDGRLSDLLIIVRSLTESCVGGENVEQSGDTSRDFDLEEFRRALEDFHEDETTVHSKLFYTEGHRGKIYMHCFIDAIDSLHVEDHTVDIVRMLCDVLVISWAREFTYHEIKRTIVSMQGEVEREVERDRENLQLQHDWRVWNGAHCGD